MDAVVKPLAADNVGGERALPTREQAEEAVRTLITWVGDNPNREGLRETPNRVVEAFSEIYSGYDGKPAEILKRTFTDVSGYEDMILIRDIPFYSHCEHHMLPFFGNVHLAYYPTDGVVGLSKVARTVDIFARRLQSQESMTAQICDAMEECLGTRGVAVMVEAEHMCMSMRGIKKSGSSTMTSRFTGIFRDSHDEREKFLSLVRPG